MFVFSVQDSSAATISAFRGLLLTNFENFASHINLAAAGFFIAWRKLNGWQVPWYINN